jgi:hypothetical protein
LSANLKITNRGQDGGAILESPYEVNRNFGFNLKITNLSKEDADLTGTYIWRRNSNDPKTEVKNLLRNAQAHVVEKTPASLIKGPPIISSNVASFLDESPVRDNKDMAKEVGTEFFRKVSRGTITR